MITITKEEIIDELEQLPPESLGELQTFIRFLRFKSDKQPNSDDAKSSQQQWQAALQATFGMWADRVDEMGDSVAYVQNIRRGHRLDEWLEQRDETG